MQEQLKNRNKVFEEKIKPILTYVGTIGAILMAAAYVAVVFVLIFGFKIKSNVQTITFAVINAVIGLIIMQFLKIQGISFAKQIPENKTTLEEYWNTKTKDKKLHSIKYFWVKTLITDILIKGISIAATTAGVIYIIIEGSQDYSLLLLAVVNLILFICFGLLSLTKAYDFFNEQHIPFIKEQLNETKNKKEIENVRNTEEQSNDSTQESSRTSSEE